ncbi:MAG: alcohol dehydrogenase catalytic domain-containing protein [Chloroflexi bacterium]|nr:alcohol dehydrogenase catalytic domain-containing protein [Chloroflexota bacterium]
MKAVMLYGPEQMEVVDLPDPVPGPGEVLVRIEACSMCGSDLEAYHGWHPKVTYPRVLGHESAGTVVALGEGVGEPAVGTRVCCSGGAGCGNCGTCRAGHPQRCPNRRSPGFTAHGAYAEYLSIPAAGAIPIPDHVSFPEAALVQPLSISNHAVNRAGPQPGEWVAVLGAGPIGLGVMLLAKRRGARVLATDVVDYRLDLAKRLGADVVVNPRRQDPVATARELSGGKGFDRVVECVGSDQDETLGQAVAMVKPKGLVVVVGSFAQNRATIPIVDFKFGEKELKGSQGAPEGYRPALDLVASGQIDVRPLITHLLPLPEAERGLRLMDEKAEGVIKVVLEPHAGAPHH